MKKIKPIRVEIQDFQSISYLEFEINGFTCITGKSNIGKSSIVRAVSSSILHSPVGGMIRKGKKVCKITLDSETWGFSWEKGQGVSRYILPHSSRTLDKLGLGQIQDIRDMGFGSVKVGNKDIYPWLASQWDPLFLLRESGQSITEFISDISRLSVLQNAIRLSFQKKKKLSDDLKRKSEEKDNLNMKLRKYQNIERLEDLQKEIDSQLDSILEYEKSIEKKQSILSRLENLKNSIIPIIKITKIQIPDTLEFERILSNLRKAETAFVSLNRLSNSVEKLSDISSIKIPSLPDEDLRQLSLATSFHDRIKSLSSDINYDIENVFIPDISVIDRHIGEISRLKIAERIMKKIELEKLQIRNMLSIENVRLPSIDNLGIDRLRKSESVFHKISKLKNEIENLECELGQADKELQKVQEELSSIPACPTCERPWNGHLSSCGISVDGSPSGSISEYFF